MDDPIQELLGLVGGGGRPALGAERGGHLGQPLLGLRIVGRHIPHEGGLVRLSAAGQQGRDHRDARAAAEVAHEVVDAGGIANLLVTQVPDGQGRERHEDEPHGHAGEHVRPHDVTHGDLEIEPSEHPRRRREDREPERDQHAAVDPSHERADHRHRCQRPEAPRRDGLAALERRVTEQRL